MSLTNRQKKEIDQITLKQSRLTKPELWKEISKDDANQWLVNKTPFSKHFINSVRLQGSKKARRDYFFASRKLDSSVLKVEGLEFYWTQATFNERDKLVQEMLAKNPTITDAKILAKFKPIILAEVHSRVKDNAEWVISGRKTESAKRFVNIFLTVLALFFLFLLKTCVDVMNTPPSESQFMKACKGQMMTEERCKATEKRNRQFEKDMDEIFP